MLNMAFYTVELKRSQEVRTRSSPVLYPRPPIQVAMVSSFSKTIVQ